MKRKSHKIIKTCALSLSLLLVGGIAVSPFEKSFAQIEANQVVPKTTKTVRIHFNKEIENYSVWVWYAGENGKEYKFDKKDSYGPYVELEVSNDVKFINYLIADIDNGWKKDVEQDRSFNLKDNDTTEIWVKSGVVEHYVTNPNGSNDNTNTGNDSDNPEKSDKTTIRIYYLRKDVRGWEVWLYNDNYELVKAKFDKTDSEGRNYAEISLDGNYKEVRYFITKDDGAIREYEGTKDQNGYRTLLIKDGKAEDLVRASNEPDINEKETITFRVKNAKEGYGIWYWHEGEEGKFLELTPGEYGYSYATTEVPKGLDEIPFFVTNREKGENGEWMRDIVGADKRNRTLYPKHAKGIEFEFGQISTKNYDGGIPKTTKTERKTIPGKVKYEADDSLDFEKQEVEKSPVDGEKEITTVTEPGKEPVVTEKVTKNPVHGLTKVGNKKVETVKNADGSTTTTTTIYEVNPETGKLEKPTSTTKTTMAPGTIEDIAKTTKVTTEKVPGKVKYEADDSLDFEEKKEDKAPVDGEKKVTTVSQPGKEDVVTEDVIKEAKDGVTKVGNKKVETKTNDDGSTTTTTTTYDVDPETGKLSNPQTTTKEKTEPEQPSKQEYLLIFNGNAGSPASQRAEVKDGEKIEGIKEPTRDGYKFVKWVILGTDKTFDLSKNFNKEILAKGDNSLILVAVWEKVEKDPKPGKDSETKPDPKPGKDSDKKPETKPEKPKKDSWYWLNYQRLFGGLGTTQSKESKKTFTVKKYQYDRLIKAYRDNKTMVEAAKFLLENCPKTVRPVKAKLEKQVRDAEKILKKTEKILEKIEESGVIIK